MIKMWVETGFANAMHEDEMEVADDEWAAMTSEQQANFLDEVAREYRNECIDFGASAK